MNGNEFEKFLLSQLEIEYTNYSLKQRQEIVADIISATDKKISKDVKQNDFLGEIYSILKTQIEKGGLRNCLDSNGQISVESIQKAEEIIKQSPTYINYLESQNANSQGSQETKNTYEYSKEEQKIMDILSNMPIDEFLSNWSKLSKEEQKIIQKELYGMSIYEIAEKTYNKEEINEDSEYINSVKKHLELGRSAENISTVYMVFANKRIGLNQGMSAKEIELSVIKGMDNECKHLQIQYNELMNKKNSGEIAADELKTLKDIEEQMSVMRETDWSQMCKESGTLKSKKLVHALSALITKNDNQSNIQQNNPKDFVNNPEINETTEGATVASVESVGSFFNDVELESQSMDPEKKQMPILQEEALEFIDANKNNPDIVGTIEIAEQVKESVRIESDKQDKTEIEKEIAQEQPDYVSEVEESVLRKFAKAVAKLPIVRRIVERVALNSNLLEERKLLDSKSVTREDIGPKASDSTLYPLGTRIRNAVVALAESIQKAVQGSNTQKEEPLNVPDKSWKTTEEQREVLSENEIKEQVDHSKPRVAPEMSAFDASIYSPEAAEKIAQGSDAIMPKLDDNKTREEETKLGEEYTEKE